MRDAIRLLDVVRQLVRMVFDRPPMLVALVLAVVLDELCLGVHAVAVEPALLVIRPLCDEWAYVRQRMGQRR